MAANAWFLAAYVAILVLVAVLPMYAVFRTPYRISREHKAVVMELLKEKPGGPAKAAEFLQAVSGENSLNRNSTRVTLATILFVLLALTTFHLLFFGLPDGMDATIFTTVLAMLASLLSAVVGFYFGGKATERAVSKATPDLSSIDPEEFVRRVAQRPDAGRILDRVGKSVDKAKRTLQP